MFVLWGVREATSKSQVWSESQSCRLQSEDSRRVFLKGPVGSGSECCQEPQEVQVRLSKVVPWVPTLPKDGIPPPLPQALFSWQCGWPLLQQAEVGCGGRGSRISHPLCLRESLQPIIPPAPHLPCPPSPLRSPFFASSFLPWACLPSSISQARLSSR